MKNFQLIIIQLKYQEAILVLHQHKLELKVGAPIMAMRNLEPPRLVNGTRLVVKQMLRNVIVATILTGCGKGEDVFIPRIGSLFLELEFLHRFICCCAAMSSR